jgi:hypothetical protein
MAAFHKISILVLLVAVSIVAASVSKEECDKAGQAFVEDYNLNAGDKYVKELDKVTGCWEFGSASDMKLQLIMKTGNGYYKACHDVIVTRPLMAVQSYGTCRR